jgi:hypothetical protein
MTKEKLVVARQNVMGKFFSEFYEPIRPFFRELVSAFKASPKHNIPVYIADYYDDRHDKEVAVLSTLCMRWDKDIYSQVQAMMDIIGKNPWEWFISRSFVNISVGNIQKNRLLGTSGMKYWKIARMFDRFYMLFCECGALESIGECFQDRKGCLRFSQFMSDVFSEIECEDKYGYKASVVELVMRDTDGIGLGLWNRRKVTGCPRSLEIFKFMRIWIPEFNQVSWDFPATIRWFGLDRESDFMYLWLAWSALSRKKPKQCSRLSSLFYTRFAMGVRFSPSRWKNYFPDIEF